MYVFFFLFFACISLGRNCWCSSIAFDSCDRTWRRSKKYAFKLLLVNCYLLFVCVICICVFLLFFQITFDYGGGDAISGDAISGLESKKRRRLGSAETRCNDNAERAQRSSVMEGVLNSNKKLKMNSEVCSSKMEQSYNVEEVVVLTEIAKKECCGTSNADVDVIHVVGNSKKKCFCGARVCRGYLPCAFEE